MSDPRHTGLTAHFRGFGSTGGEHRRFIASVVLAAPAMVIWGLYCAVMAFGQQSHGPGWLLDSDCYLWLQRTQAIVLGGQYPLPAALAGNDNLPLAILMLLVSAPLEPLFASWPDALFHVGYWISPVLFLGTLALLAGAARSLGGVRAAILAPLVAVATAPITGWYLPGRPDHHSVIHLCFTGLLWGLLRGRRASQTPGDPGLGVVGFAVLGLWTSIECAPAAVAAAGLFGARYFFSKPPVATALWARWSRFLALLAWGLGCAYLVEHGCDLAPAWITDSLSLRFVLSAGAAAVACLAAGRLIGHGTPLRRAAVCVAAVLAAVAAFLLAPRTGDPVGTAQYRFVWGFLCSITSDTRSMANHEQALPLMAFYWLGAPFFLVMALLWGWLRSGRGAWVDRLWLALIMLAYAALSLLHLRWSQYVATTATLILSAVIGPRLARHRPHRPCHGGVASAMRVQSLVISLALSLAPRLAWIAFARPQPWRIEPWAAQPVLDHMRLAWEEDRRARGPAADGVLTHMMLGTTVAYRWGAIVLATPYVHDADKILTAFRLFNSTDARAAVEELRRLGYPYALVLTTVDIPEFNAYRRLRSDSPPVEETFLQRLAGPAPPGRVVAEAPLPSAPEIRIRLVRLEP